MVLRANERIRNKYLDYFPIYHFLNIYIIDIIHILYIFPFKLYNSVVLSIFTKLYSHHHFLIPLRKLYTHQRSLPISPSFYALEASNLLSAFMGLSVLEISYEWNPVACSLWSLATFTQHNVFTVHSWRSMYSTLFLCSLKILHCTDTLHFVYLSIS